MATVRVRPDAVVLSGMNVDDATTIAALAARFGVAPQTVHNCLGCRGCAAGPSPATVRQDISDDEIVRLYLDGGRSAAEIAEQLGCAASLVYAQPPPP